MVGGFRLVRRVLGAVIIAFAAVSMVGYAIYAANGILNEVEARETREQHDESIVGTATALADRLTAVADGRVTPEGVVTADAADTTDTAQTAPATSATTDAETAAPTETASQVPTEPPTDVPTETATATIIATDEQPKTLTAVAVAAIQAARTNTPEPSATPTATSTPTSTVTPSPEPTATASPTATVKPTITPIPTNTVRPTVTPIPTNTLRPTVTPIPTDTTTPTATATPTLTPTPTLTFTPSITPTLTPTFTATIPPTATYVIEGTYAIPYETPVVPIPAAMPFMDTDPDVTNFLLLGSDTSGGGVGHTDVIILVSVNKRAGSVAMWHIPRDLFVYIPNHTMERINLAYALGESSEYPGGGFGLMQETIRYNFGIEVDHFARVDFDGYMRIIQELGGLDISVDCAIADWRLKSPELDQTVEDNWEYYTLPIGRQTLTPYMALWYARSRKTTNDLDRGRRQMDVLRAMWHQAREQGLFAQVTQLWPEAMEVVETDMQLTDVLSMVPLAVGLDMNSIARYSGTTGEHYESFVTPDDGREVVLPRRGALQTLVESFLAPPTGNRLGRQAVTVDIVDATAYGLGFDYVAADRLAWEGFAARVRPPLSGSIKELSTVYDHTGQAKSSAAEDLQRVLRVSDAQVVTQPDPNRAADFRVEIGRAYNSCVYGNAEDDLEAGPPLPTPTSAATDDNSTGTDTSSGANTVG